MTGNSLANGPEFLLLSKAIYDIKICRQAELGCLRNSAKGRYTKKKYYRRFDPQLKKLLCNDKILTPSKIGIGTKNKTSPAREVC